MKQPRSRFAAILCDAGRARGLSVRALHRRLDPAYECAMVTVWRWTVGQGLPPEEALTPLLDAVGLAGEARQQALRAWVRERLRSEELRAVMTELVDAAA